jgi:ribosome maturation factor RimP
METRSDVIDRVSEITRRVIAGTNLELLEVKYFRGGGKWILRLYIDKPTGIGVEDCQRVSAEVEKELDQYNFLSSPYVLEVSSPGIERVLNRRQDFERFTGRMVEIRTLSVYQGKKKFVGILRGIDQDQVLLEEDGGETLSFPMKELSLVRLQFKWRGKI